MTERTGGAPVNRGTDTAPLPAVDSSGVSGSPRRAARGGLDDLADAPEAAQRPLTDRSASAADSGATAAPAIRRVRKARLRIAQVDPWSVFKTALLFAIAGGIIFWVATYVVWAIIGASGLFDAVNRIANELLATPGAQNPFRIEDYISTNKVLGLAALIGVVDVLLVTALATLFSFLYNLSASILGGLEVTLAED